MNKYFKGLLIASVVTLCSLSLVACDSGDTTTTAAPKTSAASSSTPAASTATTAATDEATASAEPTPSAVTETPATQDPNATPEPQLTLVSSADDGVTVTCSSNVTNDNWSPSYINDGIIDDLVATQYGWTSMVGRYIDDDDEADEWIALDLGAEKTICRVIAYPRQENSLEPGLYFPVDYTIDVSSDGTTWTTVYTKTDDYGAEDSDTDPRIINITPVAAQHVRIHATSLTNINAKNPNDGPLMQLAELEVYAS